MNSPDVPPKRPIGPLLAMAGFGVALAAGIAALVAGLGVRLGWWDYRAGFFILQCAVVCGIGAAAICLWAMVAALRRRLRGASLLGIHGLIIGTLVFGVPWYLVNEGRKLPVMHDITTDTEQPPAFVAVLPLRQDAPNTAVYGGAELAALQRNAYPDLAPALLAIPPAAAFELALGVARRSGWEIIAAAPAENRIEATATTAWFGFKDDIVIRIRPTGGGSRVDMRSVSRVGRSDLGANARRIREFLRMLSANQSK